MTPISIIILYVVHDYAPYLLNEERNIYLMPSVSIEENSIRNRVSMRMVKVIASSFSSWVPVLNIPDSNIPSM